MNGGSEWGNVVEEHVSRQLRKTCRIINFHLCKCCVLVFSRFHTVSHFLLLYFLQWHRFCRAYPCFNTARAIKRLICRDTQSEAKVCDQLRQTNKSRRRRARPKTFFPFSIFFAICRIVTLCSLPSSVSCLWIY